MATEKNTARKPYERPTLVKTALLNKIVANGSVPNHFL